MTIHHAVPPAAGAAAAACPQGGATGSDSITAWRCRLLYSAGFPDTLAHLLAATPGVDIHALLNLVDRGCPPELAVRILGPFTDDREQE
ncbi:hypothetical protein LVY72_14980 [Arthrobacter sp. I2-34]|uniref:DUF2795 domain-containing protein n=1 Tax=Arthrobacter hankyongi TaxID=2904801 RepID=A0ABS9L931_9MICC|nr:hypothetical protein [Arthrobacter hankyongi]MCG2623201.1 hypothetical protein [Arthrobacter hankyongi]